MKTKVIDFSIRVVRNNRTHHFFPVMDAFINYKENSLQIAKRRLDGVGADLAYFRDQVEETIKKREVELVIAKSKIQDLSLLLLNNSVHDALKKVSNGARKSLSSEQLKYYDRINRYVKEYGSVLKFDHEDVLFIPDDSWLMDLFEFSNQPIAGRIYQFDSGRPVIVIPENVRDMYKLISVLIHESFHKDYGHASTKALSSNELLLNQTLNEAMTEMKTIRSMSQIYRDDEVNLDAETNVYKQERKFLTQLIKIVGSEELVDDYLRTSDSSTLKAKLNGKWDSMNALIKKSVELKGYSRDFFYKLGLNLIYRTLNSEANLQLSLDIMESVDSLFGNGSKIYDYLSFEQFDVFDQNESEVVTTAVYDTLLAYADDEYTKDEIEFFIIECIKDKISSYVKIDSDMSTLDILKAVFSD